jgi:diguanylate cyclase (GGDEF)-like protein
MMLPRKSLRFKLLMASLVIEALMLALLVGNSVRLIREHLVKQAEVRIQAIELAYKTTLAAPLAARDYPTLRDILEGWKRSNDVRYLVVTDSGGQVLSAVGWERGRPLPMPTAVGASGDTIHVAFDVDYLGTVYGRAHYGLSAQFIDDARTMLFEQSIAIALLELTMTFLLLMATGYWLTRDFTALSEASKRIARGEFDVRVPVRGNDEVASVAHSFNAMADAVQARIEELAHTASHDALTGLANRHAFEQRLQADLAHWRPDAGESLTVFYIDLDQFKIINDTCGHAAGDFYLKDLARRLERLCSDAFLARLGGDEFGLILHRLDIEAAERMAQHILDDIRAAPFAWETWRFNVGASIGIAQATPRLETASDLLMAADTACFAAKESGRNRARLFRPEDEYFVQRHADFLSLSDISSALGGERLRLHGQRIVPVHDRLVPYAEVLVRMLGDDGQLVPPARFIPAAERYGLIALVDRWVIDTACAQIARWRQGGRDAPRLNLNLSGLTLADPGLSDFIRYTFDSHGVAPTDVGFEITESCAISELDHALAFIDFCQDIGCSLALDDFGSGLSSFGYLKRFKVQSLKIDGQFVRNADQDADDRAVIESLVRLANLKKLHTVAEFVVSDSVLATVRSLGVDYAQGYALHVPEPLEALVA